MVLLIMSIVAVLGFDAIASFEANQRADRAACEALAAFRYARNLAMTTGKNAKVALDPNANTISVYWMSNGTTWDASPVASGMNAGGQWVLNLSNARELVGTTFTVSPTTTDFVYGPLGSCATTATIHFAFGDKSKSLVVASVGDPQIQ